MNRRSVLSSRMKLILALAPVCFLGSLVATTGVEAHENYALIVSASDYPNLDPKYWLKGPKNDAVLVRDYLLNSSPVKFEPQNVTTLGSGDGMTLATHQVILDNLKKIALEAKAGDFVFLQFSGHGSQQPATTDTSEMDGRDEVFLSADTKMAPPDNPSYFPNVLTDNEVGDSLTAIRKTGAFVWVVFDSCHSGTMTRGAPDETGTATREITPAELGMPDSAFKVPASSGEGASRAVPMAESTYADNPTDPNEGGMVAFFAAQTNELAQETPFDVTQPDGTDVKLNYGVFTHTIFSALAKNPNMTYRQLAQSVLADYAANNSMKPTPLFEGKLDAPVFGSNGIVPTEQWPTVVGGDGAITISAGQLHGLAAGTKLLVLPSPAASNDEAIGVMQVASSTELRSTLVPSSDDTHPLIDAKAVPAGTYVRLAEVSYPFELVVSKPDPATTAAADVKSINDALTTILADPKAAMKLRVVDPGAPADVRLAVLSDDQIAKIGGAAGVQATAFDPTPKLWLLPKSGVASLAPQSRAPDMPLPAAASAVDASFTGGLEKNLVEIFRATGLSRLSQASTFSAKDFALSFGLQAAGSSKIDAMAAEETPIIHSGDRLHIDMTNTSDKPMDINVLYIDHDYGITLLCQAHLAQQDHLFQPLADIEDSDIGSERIVAVINESGKDLTDLSFLAQPGIPTAKRGLGEQGLLGMIDDLGAGVPTRAIPVSSRDTKTPRGAVVMVPLEAQPATGAQKAAEVRVDDPRTPEGSCQP